MSAPAPAVDDELRRAGELLRHGGTIGMACHVGPDGDALGSMLALHHLCRQQGATSVASWPQPFTVAPHYTFLPGLELCTPPEQFPRQPDVMVTFDCGSLGRLGELAPVARDAAERGRLVVLDHHRTNDRYGSINVVDPDAAATAVVVRRLAEHLGWPLCREAAQCLYTGLVTDTGRFQYEATTPDVFRLAAELASFELPIARMSRQLFEEHTFEYLKLVSQCLGRAELDRELGLVSTVVTSADLAAFGVGIDETEGLIDLVRRAREAEVACVLKDVEGGVRVSMRALGAIDVGAIAARFGGGGHAFASGWTAQATVEEVLDQIRRAVGEARADVVRRDPAPA